MQLWETVLESRLRCRLRRCLRLFAGNNFSESVVTYTVSPSSPASSPKSRRADVVTIFPWLGLLTGLHGESPRGPSVGLTRVVISGVSSKAAGTADMTADTLTKFNDFIYNVFTRFEHQITIQLRRRSEKKYQLLRPAILFLVTSSR